MSPFRGNNPRSNLKDVTVLSVDDDQFMRQLVERLLNQLGVEKVMAVGDATQALDYLTSGASRVDVVLMDLNMPGMNGVEFVRRLRESADSQVAELPVVILTDHDSAGVVTGMIKLGIHGFLAKPVKPEELETTLLKAVTGDMLKEGDLGV